MNEIETERDLRDFYQSITPAGSAQATRRVDASIRARRELSAAGGDRVHHRVLAGIAAALALAIVSGIGFSVWRAGPLPGVAVESPSVGASPSTSRPAEPSVFGPPASATPQPTPTPRAPTKSTPSHHFSATGSMDANYDTATLLQDGRVLMTGAEASDSQGGRIGLTSAEIYDPDTGKFSPTGRMVESQVGATATLLHDGRVLVAGGVNYVANGQTNLATAELYDPATGEFTLTGSMIEIRAHQTATLLGSGEVLIAGGDDLAPDHARYLSTAELYDPATGSFHSTGSMIETRSHGQALLLRDGRVLVCNGESAPTLPGGAELYDPSTGTFAIIRWLAMSPYVDTVTELQDGRVLLAGGEDGTSTVAAAHLYDPVAGSWSSTGSMTTARESHRAILLSDGKVLIAGGFATKVYGYLGSGGEAVTRGGGPDSQSGGYFDRRSVALVKPGTLGYVPPPPNYLTSAELYDPATGKFTRIGSMQSWRHDETVTLLRDGRVLFAGGDQGTGHTAELYQP